jgi:uncharacterized protein (DUF779 family)
MTELPQRVVATEAALYLIERLRQQHGAVMFHQSGGCCDGSSPICFAAGDYIVAPEDIRLGEIGGAPFFMSPSQFGWSWRRA